MNIVRKLLAPVAAAAVVLFATFISDLRAGHPVDSEVYTFLVSPDAVKVAMARLEADVAQAFPRHGDVKYFFSRHEVGTKVSAIERAYLEECWSSLASPRAHASSSGTMDSSFESRRGLVAA